MSAPVVLRERLEQSMKMYGLHLHLAKGRWVFAWRNYATICGTERCYRSKLATVLAYELIGRLRQSGVITIGEDREAEK